LATLWLQLVQLCVDMYLSPCVIDAGCRSTSLDDVPSRLLTNVVVRARSCVRPARLHITTLRWFVVVLC